MNGGRFPLSLAGEVTDAQGKKKLFTNSNLGKMTRYFSSLTNIMFQDTTTCIKQVPAVRQQYVAAGGHKTYRGPLMLVSLQV